MVTVYILMLTACGAGGPSTKLNVTMTDYQYDPMEYTIPAGQEISLKIANKGQIMHEFVIMKYGQTVGDDFGPEDEDNIYWEIEVEPGDSTTATFTAPSEPGEYQIVCGTQGHFKAGMVAKMTIVQ